MTLIKKLVGSQKKIAVDVLKHKETILRGTFVAIDPASTTAGYAVFEKGILISNGFVSGGKNNIGARLNQILDKLPDVKPEVLIIEKVRTSTGHYFLTWSAGAIVAKYGTEVVEVTTGAWRKNIDDSYIKSDARDSLEIGLFALTICKENEDD